MVKPAKFIVFLVVLFLFDSQKRAHALMPPEVRALRYEKRQPRWRGGYDGQQRKARILSFQNHQPSERSTEARIFSLVKNAISTDVGSSALSKKLSEMKLSYRLHFILLRTVEELVLGNKKTYGKNKGADMALWTMGDDFKEFLVKHVRDQMNSLKKKIPPSEIEAFAKEIEDSSFDRPTKEVWLDAVLAYSPASHWPDGPLLNPIEQLAYFETQHNAFSAGRTPRAVSLPVKNVSKEKAQALINESTPKEALSRFIDENGNYLVPLHPQDDAQDANLVKPGIAIPFLNERTVSSFQGHYTASRSCLTDKFSIKMPTRFANPDWGPSMGKADMRDDIIDGLDRSVLVHKVDQALGKNSQLKVLRELFGIVDKSTKNGILVRDLTELQDGYYYMPAFSVWSAGSATTQALGVDFNTYWRDWWAGSFGKAKALLFLRYGFRLQNPHEQQWLLQMKKEKINGLDVLVPTGGIVIRDLSDIDLVSPVAKIISPDHLHQNLREGLDVRDRFDDLGLYQFLGRKRDRSWVDQTAWMKAHSDAIRDTISKELQIDVPEDWDNSTFYESSQFIEALKRYHQTTNLGEAHK